MSDIQTRADIDRLLYDFYQKIIKDEEIGYFFTEVVKLDLIHHLPKIADFWETTLFHQVKYKGNPIAPHLAMSQKSPMTKAHFDRWVTVFCETVDGLFAGAMAEMAKQRAQSIATVMHIKIKTSLNF
ncbi:group III truncated hemoglobin [Reichenbachiella carrageenanivorans]|uniref:Group III truncated hemoglobin n=1 Tax=Reichenbachiella carrageenanivorans TaxID=2979869 RepID=A0ABY6D434_9BACT|nr:group III truncated hemoglobin [Reichenbachiella carrageenanivorans]UXX80906.1 group III truncated hemoglobin [Reichenbachiella carrageenanivorans]